jgi:tetratricopeptide (TPR) repeat protein/transglutaminase-like putative cysteine protease
MRGALIALSALAWTACCVAADQVQYGPAPSWVQPTPLPRDAGTSSDAAFRFVLTDWQLNFSAAADESYVNNVLRIQTPQGLQALGTLTIPWDPATSVLTVHRLHIIRGTQVIDVLANGQTFTVLRRENSLEYATLNGILTAVIQPAGLEVGDLVDLAFSIRHSDPVLTGLSERFVTGWPPLPIDHLRLRAAWPSAMAMRWKASDPALDLKETRRGDTTEISAAVDDLQPLPVPEGAPARYGLRRWVELSDIGSWGEVVARLAPLYVRAASLSSQSPLNAEIARIRAASPDPATRALAALALVQDRVRYVFLAMNEGGLVPAAADLTWSRRFGDCKAKSALLLALLHGLDIKAEPVAVNTLYGDMVGSALPMVSAFNHVLVRAQIAGQTYWLDGARAGDRRLDELSAPPYRYGLPLVARSSDLVQIPPTPLAQPDIEETIRLDASSGIPGAAKLHAEATLTGPVAMLMRLGLGTLGSADREQRLRDFWTKALPDAKAESVSATFDEQTGAERLTVDGSMSIDWQNGRYQIKGLELFATGNFKRAPGPNSDAPFAVLFPTYNRAVETILLPHGAGPFMLEGDDIDRTVAGSVFQRHASIAGDLLTATATVRSLVPEIPSSEATGAKQALDDITGSNLYLLAPRGHASAPGVVPPSVAPAMVSGAANNLIASGNAALNRQDYDTAIAKFADALMLDPNSAMALADRGLAHAWKGESELANSDFDAAARIDARNPVVPRGRGLLAEHDRKFTEAITDFTASLQLEPDNAFTLGRRGGAYAASGEAEKALADYAAAIRLRPEYLDAYGVRARILRAQGRDDEALKEADAMVAANASNARAYIEAAVIQFMSGRNDAAMGLLSQAVNIAPSASNYLTRAILRPKNDLTGRRADADAALKLDPNSAPALATLAAVQADASEYADAVKSLNAAIASSGATSELLIQRGIVYARSGSTQLAEQDFTAARAKATTAAALNEMCWDMATTNVGLSSALSACDAGVALAPDSHPVLDSRGFVLLRLGRYADSVAAYDAAIKAGDPYSVGESLYGRGIAERRKGDIAAADVDLRNALRLDARLTEIFTSYGVTP